MLGINSYEPRDYQIPIFDAICNKGYRKVIAVLPRRAGKDLSCWNLVIYEALHHIGVYFYCLPTFSQGRRVLWDNLTISGERLLDYLPTKYIENINSAEMKIRLSNGSLIQILGSDTFDRSLVGTNPRGIVFSEAALSDLNAYRRVRPILAANDGWVVMISTPRGKNEFYDLFKIAEKSKDWFAYRMGLCETKHITQEAIDEERREGFMSEDLIQQEFYCSFDLGVEGTYYGKYIDKMKVEGRIGNVPYQSSHQVHTAWDIGRDTTAIIFFQVIGQAICIIDYHEKAKESLEYFVKLIKEKPYNYGKHFVPHDMRVTEWAGPKFTRIEKARQLGIKVTPVDEVGIEDGIEHVRCNLGRMWIDEHKCSQLIKCLENYRNEYDATKRVYKSVPLHNWASHGADATRYLCLSLPKTQDGLSAKELNERYARALGGPQDNVPAPFKTGIYNY